MEKKYTPMMQQYLKIKEKHQDTLILFRLGDFYELFFEDAKIASRELQLALTGKSAGVEERVPMCGVPHHAIATYIDKLIQRGYKVGIVEQLENPAEAKGIVERDVVQIITPGCNIEIKEKENNYIGCVDEDEHAYIFAYCDISTGELFVENLEKEIEIVGQECENLSIKEIVVSTSFSARDIRFLKEKRNLLISYENQQEVTIDHSYLLSEVRDFRQQHCIARLTNYIKQTQKRDLDYVKKAKVLRQNQFLQMDGFSRMNLELVRTIRSEESYGTLFWMLDQTKTHMGSRQLKQWVLKPICDEQELMCRQNIIEVLIQQYFLREDIQQDLKSIYDLERLIAKINFGSASGRDFLQLKKSLQVFPTLKAHLSALNSNEIASLDGMQFDFTALSDTLEQALDEDAPITVKEGGIFKQGYHPALDELIALSHDGKAWVAQLETLEKERTGIKTLRVGYNRVFGYYIEVSKGAIKDIPLSWGYERKQTTVNSERFISQELKEKEEKILHAEEQRCSLEYELFQQLRKHVTSYTAQIQQLASFIAYLDCLSALAQVSVDHHFVRPTFHSLREIYVKDGRHPVIEKVLASKSYVPNDIVFDEATNILIITGPNMGGKSTYMRQFALIVILAQIGCFVPAKEARLMIFDHIFTRIGASDDLISGQSTFMVEMSETNYALRHATDQSLLLFDEIGRGTATFDGMALAQAIVEYIASKIQAKTMFSTHYHEITKITEQMESVKNMHVSVAKCEDRITFLYKIQEGAMNQSYGIHVASLAHLPQELIQRAKTILRDLNDQKIETNTEVMPLQTKQAEAKWMQELKAIDPLTLSPLEALNFLYELKRKMKE